MLIFMLDLLKNTFTFYSSVPLVVHEKNLHFNSFTFVYGFALHTADVDVFFASLFPFS